MDACNAGQGDALTTPARLDAQVEADRGAVVRGAILFNGNAESERQLIEAAAPFLLASRHVDPDVAAARRVVLVTAGWGDREHDEGHVKRALNDLGLASQFENGFDTRLVNLSLASEQRDVFSQASDVAHAWEEARAAVRDARAYYVAHNAHLMSLFRTALNAARAVDPTVSIGRIAALDQPGPVSRPLLRYALGRELRHALTTLEANDDHLVELLREIEQRAFDGAGVAFATGWREAREIASNDASSLRTR